MTTEPRNIPDAEAVVTEALRDWNRHDVTGARRTAQSSDASFLAAVTRRVRHAELVASESVGSGAWNDVRPGLRAALLRRLTSADRTEVAAATWFMACLPAFLMMRLGGWPAVTAAVLGLVAGTCLEYIRTGSARAVKE